jgi:hypothetical protein
MLPRGVRFDSWKAFVLRGSASEEFPSFASTLTKAETRSKTAKMVSVAMALIAGSISGDRRVPHQTLDSNATGSGGGWHSIRGIPLPCGLSSPDW